MDWKPQEPLSLILGTYRSGNLSSIIFDFVQICLEEKSIRPRLLKMEDLPEGFLFHNVVMGKGGPVDELSRRYIAEAAKLLFVIPEYNGSLPGVLKAFIDVVQPEYFLNKKAAIIGVATGRAGNLRGCDHLADVLMHMGVLVMPGALPISSLKTLLDAEFRLHDERTRQAIRAYVERFLAF